LAERVGDHVAVVAIDGPVVAGWEELCAGLAGGFSRRGRRSRFLSTARWLLAWEKVQEATSSYELRDDPDFDYLASGRLADLFRVDRHVEVADGELLVVCGPGAALVPHDLLWYADLPKRYAEAAMPAGGLNLGQPGGTGGGTTKRLFFIDWPLLDRHRDEVVADIDVWLDMQRASGPAFVDGATLRATLAELAGRPFRARPTFNTTPWGGHWGQESLGHNRDQPNSALGYELIAPEAGVLIGTAGGPKVEVPFQLVVAAHPSEILGSGVHQTFGTSFPVRFDYLDTVGGGNLSVHCHPRPRYMREVFGWPYTQHESYYVMVGGENADIFLGLRDDVDVDKFHREADEAYHQGSPMDIEEYVPKFPASPHQLFLIPGGTPHASGEGNVVLEISATPYLYSLRFYDWLRRDGNGELRPVHVEHAFRNLDLDRRGGAVQRDLVPRPRVLRHGQGWKEVVLGELPEMFFEVRRLELRPGTAAQEATATSFHVLNVVEGDGVLVEPAYGPAHSLVYAETLVVPASVGPYRLRPLGAKSVKVVKALVR
jgi:mannose-6-phosphate isomerase class I